MNYFAYGSNLSLSRLQARLPSARRLGTFHLPGHDLRFHKVGTDGSGKCDASHTSDSEHSVIGALYDIDPRERPVLDRIEGLGSGYDAKQVSLQDAQGRVVAEAFTYCATHVDPGLLPYCWYLHHVLVGARECRLPQQYLERLEAVVTLTDPDADRAAREYAIHGL